MAAKKITSKQLTVFGLFLRIGYDNSADKSRLLPLLKQIISDLDASIYLMHENRIYNNFVALVVEHPKLLNSLDPAVKNKLKHSYMELWRDAELNKRQLTELSDKMQASGTAPILMIKGGLRLFDDLYPSPTHRYMSDLDLYFEDADVLSVLDELDYHSDELTDFNLGNVTDAFLDQYKTQKHHLPRVWHADRPRVLEMHQHLVHLRASPYCRGDELSNSIVIPNLPKINAPNIVDQLVINILHATYGDMYSFYANFRLRNIFEGYLLYRKLTEAQKAEFNAHFDKIDQRQDVEFWQYLCFRFFEAEEFAGGVSFKVRTKFLLHDKFGQNPKANAIIYGIYFVYRLIFIDIWSAKARGVLRKKLNNQTSRQHFFQKIISIFKR
jgi:hypothetical protein